MERPLPKVRLEERREQTIKVLCDAFARDDLELAEFESRLDAAHRATLPAELDTLTGDLPAPTTAPAAPAQSPSPTRDALARGTRAVAEAVRESRTVLAVMGGVERRGNWGPARRNVVVTLMGGAELDFRDVALPAGETEVYVVAFMGGVEIIVPPDLIVDASGIAIMGGFGHASASRENAEGRPILRVSGFCLMGGVEISTRYSGESPRDARLRHKEERRRLQDNRGQLPGSRGAEPSSEE